VIRFDFARLQITSSPLTSTALFFALARYRPAEALAIVIS
jgi:hypothetical protein